MNTGNQMIRAFVDRIERIETEIKELNSDKSGIYAEAKSSGFDVKALKAVIARRRKDPAELSEHDALVEIYLAALESGTPVATRVRARAEPETVAVEALGEPVKFVQITEPTRIPASAIADEIDLTIPDFLGRESDNRVPR